MRFNELTDKQKNRIKSVYKDKSMSWDERMDLLKSEFKCSERTLRKWCSENLNLAEKVAKESEVLKGAKTKKINKEKKIFLITSAQSATPVDEELLRNMEAYAKRINGEILVIPYRYHNPTSLFSKEEKEHEWWDKKILKYLTLNRHDLNNGISVLSDIKIQPTSATPLQGLEGMTGQHSSVVGHPRFELKTIPVMDGCAPKIMFTTGCVTVPNFGDTKNGKKGEFHFSSGFAIVEIKDKDTFFFRQVGAKANGEFIDLFFHVKDGVVNKETSVEAVILGDIHVANCDPRVTDVTLNNLFKKLTPKSVFLHDIIDSQSISHHNLDDPFILHDQEMDGTNSLQKEIDDMIKWLKPFEKYNVHIVKSNHDTHIDNFLKRDWRKMATMKNAIPYMELGLARLKGGAKNGSIPFLINRHYPKFKCLGDNDNVTVKGWLCSVHGHMGASGSRGSLPQYSKLSTRIVTGHSHVIGRIGGAVSVGTSTYLRVGFNKSFSGWINAHGIINRLGKFQHIVFFNTKDGMEYTTLN